MDRLCLLVKIHPGGSATNEDTPYSSYQDFLIMVIDQEIKSNSTENSAILRTILGLKVVSEPQS